jgi:hypothetical protein
VQIGRTGSAAIFAAAAAEGPLHSPDNRRAGARSEMPSISQLDAVWLSWKIDYPPARQTPEVHHLGMSRL